MESLRDIARLGEAVIDRRGELGLTQQELADAMGVHVKTVNDIEGGKRKNVRAGTLGALDRALKWERASARRVLYGGVATPLEGEKVEEPPLRYPHDPERQDLWEMLTPTIDDLDERELAVEKALEVKRAKEAQQRHRLDLRKTR